MRVLHEVRPLSHVYLSLIQLSGPGTARIAESYVPSQIAGSYLLLGLSVRVILSDSAI